tara:strand:- start:31 stop:546 length:516 start_codon:yes stop_codon:yes gene_type:complete
MIWQEIQLELEGTYARGYALAKHLGCTDRMERHVLSHTYGTIHHSYEWGGNQVEDYGNDDGDFNEYSVLTDEEADELAYDYIMDSLWAFNSSFLAGETGIDEDAFIALAANGKCENSNDAIASLIKSSCGYQEFVDSAISADGRGHFINRYDGTEHEVKVGRKTFYIYRVD